MKIKSILKVLCAPVLAAALFVSCTGPSGPEGPQGPQGVANISSTGYSVSSWTGGPNAWYSGTFSAPISNQAGDLVEVYFVNNSGNYVPMPVSNIYVAGDQLSSYFNNNQITFEYYTSSGSPTGTWDFNVVVIPPDVQKKHPGTNWQNYSQVKALMSVQAAMKN